MFRKTVTALAASLMTFTAFAATLTVMSGGITVQAESAVA